MNATVVEESEQTLVSISEDIVTENVEQFKRLIDKLLDKRSDVPLVLDLAKIDYLCSAGVGIIASAHRQLKSAQTELIIKNPSERVARLFMVTRLDTVLRILSRDSSREGTR